MTVHAVLIVNNHGKPRLSKFYSQVPLAAQQAFIAQIFALVSPRPDSVCNFLDAPGLVLPSSSSVDTSSAPTTSSKANGKGSGGGSKAKHKARELGGAGEDPSDSANGGKDELRVIYRHYATLYFVFVVDQSESELGVLDLIQVFVESLDRCFENVCELDLIFHFDDVHAILSEVIQGGLVLETNINEIVNGAQASSRARRASYASSSHTSVSSFSSSLNPAMFSALPSLASPMASSRSSSMGGAGGNSLGAPTGALAGLGSLASPNWSSAWTQVQGFAGKLGGR